MTTVWVDIQPKLHNKSSDALAEIYAEAVELDGEMA